MVSIPRRRLVVAVFLLTVLAAVCLVAVLGVTVEDGNDPATTKQRVLETNRSIGAYEGTLVITTDTGNETTTRRFEVAVDRPGRQKLTLVDSPDRSGYVYLTNHTGSYVYDEGNETVRKLGDVPTRPDVLSQFVRAVGTNGTEFRSEDRIEGSAGVVLQYSAGGENVGLRIGGSSPELRYDARGRTEAIEVSVWVDPDRTLPLQLNQSYVVDGRRVATTMRLTDLELDPEFAADRFGLDVPPGTETVDATNLTTTYESRGALEANASLPVPAPSIPDGFAFDRGILVRGDSAPLVAATYENDGEQIGVQVSRRNVSVPGNATRVSVGNATGYYRDLATSQAVQWDCGNLTVTVSTTLGREATLSIARSIDCRHVR